MSDDDLPCVKLRPLPPARRWTAPFPWIYSDQLAWDRRTKAIAPGQICRLLNDKGNPCATIALNHHSKIAGRVLDLNPDARIDIKWLEERLIEAFSLRQKLYDTPFYRLIHAEGDGLPGVIIDRFDDLFVVQPNAAWVEMHWDSLISAMETVFPKCKVYKNAAGRTRKLEGLDAISNMERGEAPSGPIAVKMNSAIYFADILEGQKTGLFFDQRDNHRFAAGLITGGERVLDVFSHVGGFSLAMCAAGAGRAVAVDASQAALDLAQKGAEEMGKGGAYETRCGDAFDALAAFHEQGEVFDVVICDPPAFAPHKDALKAGLRAYEKIARLAAPLVAKGGFLGLCSCSHAAQLAPFREASVKGIERAGRRGRLIYTGFAGADHPQHGQLAQTSYLKSLFFAL